MAAGGHHCRKQAEISTLQAEVINLQRWQKNQNGSILRTEEKLDRLNYWIMGQLAGILLLALSTFLRR